MSNLYNEMSKEDLETDHTLADILYFLGREGVQEEPAQMELDLGEPPR
jgi:hypothetical protein